MKSIMSEDLNGATLTQEAPIVNIELQSCFHFLNHGNYYHFRFVSYRI
jgi:hypothetical protein